MTRFIVPVVLMLVCSLPASAESIIIKDANGVGNRIDCSGTFQATMLLTIEVEVKISGEWVRKDKNIYIVFPSTWSASTEDLGKGTWTIRAKLRYIDGGTEKSVYSKEVDVTVPGGDCCAPEETTNEFTLSSHPVKRIGCRLLPLNTRLCM
jgi:hypothetical protein